ncbi:hypothetical protein ACWEWG_38970 [Streptomyces sp. NPDC003758]
MQLAGEAATALIVEMTKSGCDAARAAIARFFGCGGEDTATEELRLVDAGQQELVQSAPEGRDAIAEHLQQALTIQLAAFLQKHSDGAEDLTARYGLAPACPSYTTRKNIPTDFRATDRSTHPRHTSPGRTPDGPLAVTRHRYNDIHAGSQPGSTGLIPE